MIVITLVLAVIALLVACAALYVGIRNRIWLERIEDRLEIADLLQEPEPAAPLPSPVRDYSVLEEAGRAIAARQRK